MRITAVVSAYICAAFALLAFWGAWISLSSLERLTDAAERDMASGYGFFYLFLGGIAAAFGVLSWAISKGKFGFAERPEE